MQHSAFGYWLVVIIFASLLAAVMSTADSALLSISSMITHDIYGKTFRPDADQVHLTRVGKCITWAFFIFPEHNCKEMTPENIHFYFFK